MGALIPFPSRSAPPADKTPRDRFDDAINRLAETGFHAEAKHVRTLMAHAERFGGTVRDGKTLGEVFAALVAIPAEYPAPHRHARTAAVALTAIAFPFEMNPQEAC